MSGNDERILLDLNYPDFQDELFALDSSEFKKVGKTLLKLKRMTWNELFRDKGLHWEELKSVPGKFSIRLSQSYRAIVSRSNDAMRFVALYTDHDRAYKNH